MNKHNATRLHALLFLKVFLNLEYVFAITWWVSLLFVQLKNAVHLIAVTQGTLPLVENKIFIVTMTGILALSPVHCRLSVRLG